MPNSLERLWKFLVELRRRNVYRVAIAYVAVAFVAIQAANLLVPTTTLPGYAESLLIYLAVFGFPIALVVAWAFEVTPDGIRRTNALPAEDAKPGVTSGAPSSLRRMALAGGLILLLASVGVSYLLFSGGGGVERERIGALAVLPLENMSGEDEQAYFAEGMTEALINHLSRIRSLKVISRRSTMQYRGAQLALPSIAERLGVDAVIEGSVLQADERVRISVQLVDGRSDRLLWNQSYERSFEDVLTLQAEVARAVAGAVEAEVTSVERERLERDGPVEEKAYRAYLKGQYHWSRHDEEHWRTAVDFFQESIAADSGFAHAWAGLAEALNSLGLFEHMDPHEANARARRAAERALELDPTLADAHVVLGRIRYMYDWSWRRAEEAFLRALDLSPNSAEAHHAYALFLARQRRFGEAREHLSRALELDPLSPRILNNKAWIQAVAGDYRAALAHYGDALELHADFTMTHREIAGVYLLLGEESAATRHASRAIELSSDDLTLAEFGAVMAGVGETRRAYEVLDILRSRQAEHYVSPVNLALVHAHLGDTDRALDLLERAADERSAFLVNLAVGLVFDPLRDRERFQALLQRVGLGGASAGA